MNSIGWVAFILVAIGGLNWGLVGFFNFNLVSYLFGEMSMLTRIVYSLVGLSAVYAIFTMGGKNSSKPTM